MPLRKVNCDIADMFVCEDSEDFSPAIARYKGWGSEILCQLHLYVVRVYGRDPNSFCDYRDFHVLADSEEGAVSQASCAFVPYLGGNQGCLKDDNDAFHLVKPYDDSTTVLHVDLLVRGWSNNRY